MQIIKVDGSRFDLLRCQIAKLIDESIGINFSDHMIGDNYAHDRCNEIEKYIKDGSAIVFAAVEQDSLLGWIWCHQIHRLEKIRLHIAEIAVSSSCRGQGIGSQLLSVAESYAAENGYDEVDLLVTANNNDAVKFYTKASYEAERYLMKKIIKTNKGT